MILYLLALLLSRIVPLVPPRIGYALCWLFGTIWWAVAPGHRAAVRENLRHVLGTDHARARAIEREVFRNGAISYYETFRIPKLTPAEIERLVDARGWEHLDAALAAGSGAILVSAHLSSVVLVAQIIAARGYPISAVAEPVKPERLYRLLADIRFGHGITVVPIRPGVSRALVRVLERNEIVGLVSDRSVTGSGRCVRFFDAEARLPDGAAVLALRCAAPILPAIATRRPDGRYVGLIEPPIPIERTGDLDADIERIMRRAVERLEYHIAAHPEQWTVFQPVWRGC